MLPCSYPVGWITRNMGHLFRVWHGRECVCMCSCPGCRAVGGGEDGYGHPHFPPPHPRQGKFSKVAQLRAGSIPSPEEPSPTSPERPPPVCFRSEGALCILLGVSDALCREGLLTGTCWRFVIAVYTVTGCIREACTSWEMVAGIPSRS